LGKYHKVIINEGKPEGNELITEQVMHEHKTKLFKNFQEKNIDGMIEVAAPINSRFCYRCESTLYK
jgi:hypothetical protein